MTTGIHQLRYLHRGTGLILCAVLACIMTSSLHGQKRRDARGSTTDQCIACHEQLGDQVAQMRNDIHRHFGLSCADCHGGDRTRDDAEEAMAPSRGFIGAPSAADVPQFCGRCHSDAAFMKRFDPTLRIDQQAEYATSVHGRRLAGGDTKVATCISCHGVHGILAVKDVNAPVYPLNVATTCERCHADKGLMQPYGIPTTQVAQYTSSIHGNALLKKQDLSAPTCNDCHGNHGASPPGVTSVAYVCGTCHARQADLFEQSPHRKPFEESDMAGCLVCHGNHAITPPTDAMLGTAAGSVCIQCHSDGEQGFAVAAAMHSDILRLASGIDSAAGVLSQAANAGMEVSRPLFELKDARDKLINARVVIHSASSNDVDSLARAGLVTTTKAYTSGTKALKDLDFRRAGLVISLLVILIAAASIYAKVRQIERRQRREAVIASGSVPEA